MNVTGRNGITLDDVWPDTTHAYRSVSIPGFPNFFMTMGPHSPVGNFSLIEVAEIQLAYVMQLIDLIRKGQYNEIAAGVEATERFNEERIEATQGTIWASRLQELVPRRQRYSSVLAMEFRALSRRNGEARSR